MKRLKINTFGQAPHKVVRITNGVAIRKPKAVSVVKHTN